MSARGRSQPPSAPATLEAVPEWTAAGVHAASTEAAAWRIVGALPQLAAGLQVGDELLVALQADAEAGDWVVWEVRGQAALAVVDAQFRLQPVPGFADPGDWLRRGAASGARVRGVVTARRRPSEGEAADAPRAGLKPSVDPSSETTASDAEQRVIFHVDLDAFFVSVERVLDPSLRGQPVVVGGSPSGRGVVAAASYEARAYGVRSAMPMSRAVRLCPQLVRVRGSRDAYRRASRAVFGLLQEWTPRLQRVSIDEAYLDLTGRPLVHGRGFDTACFLQQQVRERFRLDLSIGIASNRLVAKVASDAAKPRGVFEVTPGQEERMLAPLPVRRLPGIGPATAERLQAARLDTLGALVRADPVRLTPILGREPDGLVRRARGIDSSPVREPDPDALPKSISHETTFPVDRSDPVYLRARLHQLMEKTIERLQEYDAGARTVSIKLRFADFSTVTRDRTLPDPGHSLDEFVGEAVALLESVHDGRQPIRLLGVKLAGLERGFWQPGLFDPPAGKPSAPETE